jgi:5-deoxy-glucuronate isomerase
VTTNRLHHPRGSLADSAWSLVVTPDVAGWDHAGLRVATIEPGGSVTFDSGPDEALVLPLAGSVRVSVGDATVELDGRSSPFAGPTDFAYVPRAVRATIGTVSGARVAVCTARASTDLPFRHAPASGVPVEQRGAGVSSRAVRNFATPESFAADAIIAVEVITPAGNWSSYPPHKHDEARPGEVVLEELYYYEIAAGPAGPGMAYQRVYGTPERPIDLLVEVRDGDVVLIPHGWHGPAMAAPGYDLYYLNVMAGPGAERAWRITDDPAHAWVRETWRDQAIDPRLTGGAPTSTTSPASTTPTD